MAVAHRSSWLLAGIAVITLAFAPVLLCAQVAPNLGTAARFAVPGNSGVTGSAGSGTVVTGDVGSYPTASISNFPPSTVGAGFTLHLTPDAVVQQAQADAKTAYDFLAAQVTVGTLPDGLALTSAGLLSGTPTANGSFSFTVRATDSAGCDTERPYTMMITIPVPTMPEMFLMLLALVLGSLGYLYMRRRSTTGRVPDRTA